MSYPIARSLTDPAMVFGSLHPGVCQFVFADGSVRRLENGIDPTTLGLISCRNDGQIIPDY